MKLTISNISVKQVINPDFEFDRGTEATRVNSKGEVVDVNIIGSELVQNGNFEELGSELVVNGGFDDSLNNWNIQGDSITIVDGAVRLNRSF